MESQVKWQKIALEEDLPNIGPPSKDKYMTIFMTVEKTMAIKL